jgi:hypothetical protein
MKHFQAKDIQRLIDIPKHRYEYIASKIGIKPEVEEVEKTGHVHLYSFKNLLEFAFVHTANNLGLGPKAVKELLGFLSNNIDLHEAGLFNPKKTTKASVHYADSKDGKLFKLSGPDISEQGKKGGYLGKGFDKVKEAQKRMSNGEGEIHIPGLIKAYENLTALSFLKLDDFDGYITINLGIIKDRILKNIKD